MKVITLTQGQVTVVDDEDFERLNAHRWYALKKIRKNRIIWYAVHHTKLEGKQHLAIMHRVILGVTDPKIDVDHKNGNGLDNQRQNIRLATRSQNLQNQHKSPNCTSKFKGVYWHKRRQKWLARIKTNGHRKHLGCFVNEDAAGAAYDLAAHQEFGVYAHTNSN